MSNQSNLIMFQLHQISEKQQIYKKWIMKELPEYLI